MRGGNEFRESPGSPLPARLAPSPTGWLGKGSTMRTWWPVCEP